jgi:hypothetical protein
MARAFQRMADNTRIISEDLLSGDASALADGRALSHGLQERILFFAAGELTRQ